MVVSSSSTRHDLKCVSVTQQCPFHFIGESAAAIGRMLFRNNRQSTFDCNFAIQSYLPESSGSPLTRLSGIDGSLRCEILWEAGERGERGAKSTQVSWPVGLAKDGG
jgi:hypothetical protein